MAKQEAAAAAKPVEVLRGKSGKKKKLKDKYADQVYLPLSLLG